MRALGWVARLWAAATVIVWGMFFIEHLAWFSNLHHFPPLRVVGLQLLHLGLLAGLVVGWRWEVAGAIVVLATAIPFFAATAGGRAPLFIAVTCVPAVIWLIRARWSRRTPPQTPSPTE